MMWFYVQDMLNMHTKSNLKPNRALLDIAEKHIREVLILLWVSQFFSFLPFSLNISIIFNIYLQGKESSVDSHYGPPSTSYGVPVASVSNIIIIIWFVYRRFEADIYYPLLYPSLLLKGMLGFNTLGARCEIFEVREINLYVPNK